MTQRKPHSTRQYGTANEELLQRPGKKNITNYGYSFDDVVVENVSTPPTWPSL
jgi:hypothetical protein